MLKKTYKILKYIHKNPNVKKSDLILKFPDFEKYEKCIFYYVIVSNNNKNSEQEELENLILEASKLRLNNLQTAEYINNNVGKCQNSIDNSLISYSTNLNFDEYYENKNKNAWLFWFPYTITTIIAIISLVSDFI